MVTANNVADQYTNYNNTGFGNAGTGSGNVQASGSSSSSGPETGTLPNGNTYEKYDDGNYWYYKEWDDGILVIDESGYHETGSINMPLSAGQNAATSAEEVVPPPPEYVPRPNVGDLDTDGQFQRSGRYADGTYWTYVEHDEGYWTYIRHDGKGNILETETGEFVFFAEAGHMFANLLDGDRSQSALRRKYNNLANNSHHNHNHSNSNSVNNHVNSMRGTPTYDTTHGNFENGLATADVGFGSGDGSSSASGEYYSPILQVTPAFGLYLPASSESFFVTNEEMDPFVQDFIRWFGGSRGDLLDRLMTEDPGFGESMIPIWAPMRQAMADFSDGRYFWGTVNVGFAVLDAIGVGYVIRNGSRLVRYAIPTLRQGLISDLTKKFVSMGFDAKDAARLARRYMGKGHHFPITQGSALYKKLPKWFRDSPFNVLRPPGLSYGEFYKLHFFVDKSFGGAAIRKGISSWSGTMLGLSKAGRLDRIWMGLPPALKGSIYLPLRIMLSAGNENDG